MLPTLVLSTSGYGSECAIPSQPVLQAPLVIIHYIDSIIAQSRIEIKYS